MTEPRDPGETDPADIAPDRESRRGRHWAPDADDAADTGAGDEATEDVTGARAAAASDDATTHDAAADPAPDSSGAADPSTPAGRPNPDDPVEADPEPDGPQDDRDADDRAASPAVAAAASRSGPRHAAAGSGLRLQPWMLAVGAVVVIALIAWLVIGLTGGDDEAADEPPTETTTSAAETTTSAAPTPVDPVSLPQVLCMGQSYAMLQTGQPPEALLADPAAIEAQYPGSKLSTIPPGCIADSAERDQVVLALGPFPTLQEACEAGTATGLGFTAYEGSASTGLEEATCPA